MMTDLTEQQKQRFRSVLGDMGQLLRGNFGMAEVEKKMEGYCCYRESGEGECKEGVEGRFKCARYAVQF
jgi:hypothetical protein